MDTQPQLQSIQAQSAGPASTFRMMPPLDQAQIRTRFPPETMVIFT